MSQGVGPDCRVHEIFRGIFGGHENFPDSFRAHENISGTIGVMKYFRALLEKQLIELKKISHRRKNRSGIRCTQSLAISRNPDRKIGHFENDVILSVIVNS